MLNMCLGQPGVSIARPSQQGRVVLTDLVPEMLDIAARRTRARGLASIETAMRRADDLPFNDTTFDCVARALDTRSSDMAKATAEFALTLSVGRARATP
jgi:ubiquinone/menaquinone biosynthesis C-methylase UbiE